MLLFDFTKVTHNIKRHYISFSPTDTHTYMLNLNDCLTVILLGMESSKLKLNVNKTDIISIVTKQQRNKVIDYFPIKLLDNQSYITMMYRSEFRCCCL